MSIHISNEPSTEAHQHDEASRFIINHVMSNDVKSNIFDEFIGYIEKYGIANSTHVVSADPIEGADVYHYHRPNLVKHLRQPSVVTVHHDPRDNDPWLDFSAFAAPYREATRIVCLNSSQQRWLNERSYAQTAYIPHGYNSSVFRLCERSSRDLKVTLGLASRRYGRRVKGEALLLDICKRLPPDKFRFVLVGPGRSQEGFHLKSLGFDVKVFEFLPYRLFQRFYEEIDALLITSWFEGGPACVPEAVATGTPIISTRVGMVSDFLKTGTNGLFLEGIAAVDAETVASLIDPANLRELRKGARSRISSAPTWQMVASMYGEIYNQVASER